MDLMKTILTRQSTRGFLPDEVSKESLEKILLAAKAAPIGMKKFETIHLTVVTDKAMLEKLDKNGAEVMGNPDAHPLYGAPLFIMVSVNIGATPKEKLAYEDAGCIIENMLLAAADDGLGSVYIFGATKALEGKDDIIKALGIPEGYTPISSAAIGHVEGGIKEREIPDDKFTINFI